MSPFIARRVPPCSCRKARRIGRSPDTATVEDLRNYQLHLVDHSTSPISLNATITGLKFFFDVTLDRGELMAKMKPVSDARSMAQSGFACAPSAQLLKQRREFRLLR
jgi:hypothetical protein